MGLISAVGAAFPPDSARAVELPCETGPGELLDLGSQAWRLAVITTMAEGQQGGSAMSAPQGWKRAP